jgi:hypothetical protein
MVKFHNTKPSQVQGIRELYNRIQFPTKSRDFHSDKLFLVRSLSYDTRSLVDVPQRFGGMYCIRIFRRSVYYIPPKRRDSSIRQHGVVSWLRSTQIWKVIIYLFARRPERLWLSDTPSPTQWDVVPPSPRLGDKPALT